MSNKLGQLKLDAWTLLGIAVAAYLVIPGFRAFVDNTLAGTGTAAGIEAGITGVGVVGGTCLFDGAVMTLGPIVKRYDPTATVTGIGHRVFINGVDRGIKIDGSTLDVTINDEVAIYYNENMTATAGSQASRFYTAEQKFNVPCASTLSTGDTKLDPTEAHKLVLGKLPVLTIFNDDDGNQNNAGTGLPNETITANDASNLELKVVKGSKGGFSPHGKQAICVRHNSTLYTDVDISIISGVSNGITKMSALPTAIANNGKLGTKAGTAVSCWETAGTESKSTITEKYNIALETGSQTPTAKTNNPGASLNISIYDQSWFRNSDTGNMEFGYQDDNDNDVGLVATANKSVRITSA